MTSDSPRRAVTRPSHRRCSNAGPQRRTPAPLTSEPRKPPDFSACLAVRWKTPVQPTGPARANSKIGVSTTSGGCAGVRYAHVAPRRAAPGGGAGVSSYAVDDLQAWVTRGEKTSNLGRDRRSRSACQTPCRRFAGLSAAGALSPMQTRVHLTWIEGRIERWIPFRSDGRGNHPDAHGKNAWPSPPRRNLRARALVVERPRHR